MDQPPQTAQIARVVDHGLDPQRAPVLQVLFDAGVPVEGVDVDLGAVGDDLGLELTGRRSTRRWPRWKMSSISSGRPMSRLSVTSASKNPRAWRGASNTRVREVSTWRIDSSHQ